MNRRFFLKCITASTVVALTPEVSILIDQPIKKSIYEAYFDLKTSFGGYIFEMPVVDNGSLFKVETNGFKIYSPHTGTIEEAFINVYKETKRIARFDLLSPFGTRYIMSGQELQITGDIDVNTRFTQYVN